jgi:hypothetical protein
MTRQKKEKAAEFDANEFPALKEFFSGYLHEDFNDEYGSAASAARAFRGDASPEESAQAGHEWARLRKILAGRSISEVQTSLQKLGGAWRLQDLDEFHSLDAIFAGKPHEPSS